MAIFGKSKDKADKNAAPAAPQNAGWNFDLPASASEAAPAQEPQPDPVQEAFPIPAPEAASSMPLFYKDPQPLSSVTHTAFKLMPGDASFAAETNSTPLAASEFAEAARFYPIVFASGDGAPVALLGLEQRNMFVDDGKWAEGIYMPAYVRRYPFVFIAAGEDKLALGVDMGSGRLSAAGEGQALFDGEGKPSALTQQALAFCHAFQVDHQATRMFSAALKEKDLLIDRRADVTLPNGRSLALQGFEIVDPARLAALDEATVLDWHRKGWLALVHFHLASLSGFRDLLSRQGVREAIG